MSFLLFIFKMFWWESPIAEIPHNSIKNRWHLKLVDIFLLTLATEVVPFEDADLKRSFSYIKTKKLSLSFFECILLVHECLEMLRMYFHFERFPLYHWHFNILNNWFYTLRCHLNPRIWRIVLFPYILLKNDLGKGSGQRCLFEGKHRHREASNSRLKIKIFQL